MARTVVYSAACRKTGRQKADSLVGPLTRQTIGGAKRLAPRGTHKHGSGTSVSGPRLADSWRVDDVTTAVRRRVTIVNTARYADTIARGSKRHRIPKYGFKRLRFSDWPRGHFSPRLRRRFPDGEFFFKKVNHPGNKRPVRFLQTPLALYGRRAGFKVTISGVTRTRLP